MSVCVNCVRAAAAAADDAVYVCVLLLLTTDMCNQTYKHIIATFRLPVVCIIQDSVYI